MKVAILQTDIEWGKPHLNINRIDELLDDVPQADIIVLPEMFSTGFYMEPNGVAESIQSGSLRWMIDVAKLKNCAVSGSLAVQEGDKYYNRLYFVYPDGNVLYYDKIHLFSYGGENKHYTPGKERVIVTFRGVRILLQICYDLRFPVCSRNQKDYDMIIYVASWPTSRIEVWNILTRARAIENQCYVVAVNRVGEDPLCSYSGGSKIVDPYGKVIAECIDNQQSFATADIDMDKLHEFRKKFPVLEDSDLFSLK